MALAYRERERERDWDDVSHPSHSGYTVRRYPIHDRYDYDYDDRECSPLVPCKHLILTVDSRLLLPSIIAP